MRIIVKINFFNIIEFFRTYVVHFSLHMQIIF